MGRRSTVLAGGREKLADGSESKPRLLDKIVSAAGLYVMNSLFRGTQRRIHVPNSAIPESSCVWIVLFAISVGMYLS